jgi:signal peptidase II
MLLLEIILKRYYVYTEMNITLRNISILLLVLVNTGCDQISKYAARIHIGYGESIDVLGKYLILIKTENSGAFLSTGSSLEGPVKFFFLSLAPLLLLCYGIYYLLTHPELPGLLVTGISFVIGGGLGNLYDRLLYGSVTDFLHINFYFIRTGIFNVADVSIMAGMIMIVINIYFRRIETPLTTES